MNFDINSAISEMAGAMQGSVGKGVADIAIAANTALSNQKEALAALAEALQQGDLDEAEFAQELQREMLVVETQMLTVTVIGKAAVQKALQAAIGTLTSLIKPF
ncbi:MAG: hypothetical protein HRT35_29115 [Algicola sp.]|nr:hypothetical protein [Algicola sp.]